jgi:transcriptional regulator with XRE-family HTH domain
VSPVVYKFQAARLRERRQALDLPPEHIALAVGRSSETVGMWERGNVLPNPNQLATLAELLHCAPGDFFEVEK